MVFNTVAPSDQPKAWSPVIARIGLSLLGFIMAAYLSGIPALIVATIATVTLLANPIQWLSSSRNPNPKMIRNKAYNESFNDFAKELQQFANKQIQVNASDEDYKTQLQKFIAKQALTHGKKLEAEITTGNSSPTMKASGSSPSIPDLSMYCHRNDIEAMKAAIVQYDQSETADQALISVAMIFYSRFLTYVPEINPSMIGSLEVTEDWMQHQHEKFEQLPQPSSAASIQPSKQVLA